MKKKKLKIGVILDQHAAVGGGYQQAINAALLTKKISDEFTEVLFFTTYKENIKILSKVGIKADLLEINFLDKFFSSIKRQLKHPRLVNLYKLLSNYTKFEKKLIKKNIDLVYFLSPSPLALDLETLNYIITVWDLNHRYNPEFPEFRKSNIIEVLDDFYNQALKKATGIIVDSEIGKDQVKKYYSIDEDRIHIIPFQPSHSVASHKLSKKINNIDIKKKYNLNIPYVFYPAQFWAHKNHAYILQGLIDIEKRFNIKLGAIFSGSNQGSFDFITKEVKRLNLEDRVRFIGYVKDEEISELYLQSIALVMPTFLGPTNIPPLESFQLGVPVLYSDLPGLKDQVGDAALMLNLNDPMSLSDQLNNLIHDEQLRNRLIKAGYERINFFNKINRKKILIDIISDFRVKRSCWDTDYKDKHEKKIFIVDTSFAAIMISSIIKEENIIDPKIIIEIKKGIHRNKDFDESIKSLLSDHNIHYYERTLVPSPYYLYKGEDNILNKIKNLLKFKKEILSIYKPEDETLYIGSVGSSIMKVIKSKNSVLIDEGASSYISEQDFEDKFTDKFKTIMFSIIFRLLGLDNTRFQKTKYSAFPFKKTSNIINLNKFETPKVIKKYLMNYNKQKKMTLILLAGTHHAFRELPFYKQKYNKINIKLIKKHCSIDESLLIKFHQSVFGSDPSQENLKHELIQLGYKVENVDNMFPPHLQGRVPAEIIVNYYDIEKIISVGSTVNFNYSNIENIENIIDLSIYKDDTGVYSLSENIEFTNNISKLYNKLNKITLNKINIFY